MHWTHWPRPETQRIPAPFVRTVLLVVTIALLWPAPVAARHHRGHDRQIANFDRINAPTPPTPPARPAPPGANAAPHAGDAAPATAGDKPVVLFDNTHAETAGNADWTITGGYSDFADTLTHHGFAVRSLDSGAIDDAQLAGVRVVVLPEPNSPLTPAELAALKRFTEAGGGLLAIGDHGGSDRNHDGWDSVRVLNALTTPWGITFTGNVLSQAPIVPSADTEITHGVTSAGVWAGSSLTVTAPSAVVQLAFSKENGGQPFMASTSAGKGRLVCVGDSSTFDDGSGEAGHHLYNAYSNPKYTIPQLALNIVDWLSARPFQPVGQ